MLGRNQGSLMLVAGGAATLRFSVEEPTATTRAPSRCSKSRTTAESFVVSLW